jgi:flavin-dependent dehydrogenase
MLTETPRGRWLSRSRERRGEATLGYDPIVESVEIAIIGGGPAGLACAIALAGHGLRATVLERAQPPIDKACGEGLMPGGVATLRQLGVAMPPGSARPFVGVRFLDGAHRAEGRFARGPGLGIRRTRLHEALVRRAEQVGVDLRWGVRVDELRAESGEMGTSAGALAARWIVGADGLHSRVRRWAGFEARPGRYERFGVRRHFEIEPWTDFVEVHWADRDETRAEAYVTPAGEREVGVVMLWSGRKASFDGLIREVPALWQRLKEAKVLSRDRGAGPLAQRVRKLVKGRVALVGDASGYVDAITGEGLSLALREGVALAECLAQGELSPYPARRRAIAWLPETLTRLMLFAERRPRLRRRLIDRLAAKPARFDAFLGVHSGTEPWTALGPAGLWDLATLLLREGWRRAI